MQHIKRWPPSDTEIDRSTYVCVFWPEGQRS